MEELNKIIRCSNSECRQKISIPSNKHIRFSCPKCGEKYEYEDGELIMNLEHQESVETTTVKKELQMISFERLIKGLPTYFRTLKKIIQHPFIFPHTLELRDDNAYWKAFDYFTYSLVIVFLLQLPIFLAHGEKIGKFFFFFRTLFSFTAIGVLVHYFLKILGAKNYSLKYTLSVYSYIGGTLLPIFIIVFYPLLLLMGPSAFNGPREGSDYVLDLPQLGMLAAFSLFFFFIAISIFMMVFVANWLSATHKISKVPAFLAITFAGFIVSNLFRYIFNPIFNRLRDQFEQVFEAL